jgi:hypothetical protein
VQLRLARGTAVGLLRSLVEAAAPRWPGLLVCLVHGVLGACAAACLDGTVRSSADHQVRRPEERCAIGQCRAPQAGSRRAITAHRSAMQELRARQVELLLCLLSCQCAASPRVAEIVAGVPSEPGGLPRALDHRQGRARATAGLHRFVSHAAAALDQGQAAAVCTRAPLPAHRRRRRQRGGADGRAAPGRRRRHAR